MRLTNAHEPAKTSIDAAGTAPKRDPETAANKRSTREETRTDQSSSARPSHWRPDIEGLRAVAVGVVIAAHIGFPYMAGGFVGVDVFFVISGFLITSLLLREIDKTGTVSIAGFYARRAVRLLPAAATVLVATLVAAWLWLPRTRLGEIAADAAAAALNVINIRLAQEGTDYLNAEVPPSPLQHFWSLAVEEQFYIVWPLVLLAIALLGARFGRPGKFTLARHRNRGPGRTAAITAFLVVAGGASLWASATWTAGDPVWSYFGIHTRAWELAVGALIAVAAGRIRAWTPTWAAALASWAGLALIVAAVFWLDEHTVFPGTAAMLPVAGCALVIAAGCVPHRFGAQALLGIRPAQFVGKISYGLYLWHWPLIMIGPAVMGLEEVRVRHYLLLMAVAFLLTIATFYLVENPIRTRRTLVQVPSRALALGGGLIAGMLAVSIFMVQQPMPAEENGEAAEITGDDSTVWEMIGESSDVESVPANLTPSLDEAGTDEPALYAEDCVTAWEGTDLKDCRFGDPDGEKTIVLFGDSHAAQWFPAFNQLAEASGWKLLPLAKAGCSVAAVSEHDSHLDRRYTECEEWKEKAFAEIESLEPDVVVTSAYDEKEILADDPDQAWADGWAESLNRLDEAAGEVYYLADSANPPGDTPACLAEHSDNVTECVVDVEAATTRPERRAAAIETIEAETDATVVDPIPWMCDVQNDTCPVVVGNFLVYRDGNHLSPRFVAELTPQVAAAIPLEAQRVDTR
ncbi:acyltransferase family protein [Glycomyces algeriensis]|uniref:Acyltransferase n=1 Tax=Glycomyces algeriensis TaxID=256037 RepID=A0A9W6G9Q4_9ACTN|nr:acyltransferase family protein [Glycomyces algeriensis]MDA1364835.1 acyltransferase family protein [Glycomyces algeriensis]MDR7350106.1 peptidoglycan/LPS O-acetylase OafA/YrhL [Glycomyces algeriensis]GLI42819.1 acyltransferase [Glycomyces algeriensis]